MKHLTDAEKQQIAAAIAKVEMATDAELVTVFAKRADHYAFLPFLVAAIVALLVPLVAGLLPITSAGGIMLWQWLVFIVLALILRLPAIKMRLIPRRLRHYRATSLARCQFLEQNMHATEKGIGMLIFVSEAERYVEILADHGISSKIPNSEWQQLVDAFTAHVARGEVFDGFIECITGCGDRLQQQLPATSTRNELPNHLVVIDN